MKINSLISVTILSLLLWGGLKARASADELYSVSFGDSTAPAIIFLHGGPGYNSAGFEITTAQALSDRGYYVVVYDGRACGRNGEEGINKFTYEEAIEDLKGIYDKYNLKKSTLLGHSFGGAIGLMFAEKYPTMVEAIALAAVPIVYQDMFKSIIANARTEYNRTDNPLRNYLDDIQKADTASIEYSASCFYQAMLAGLYSPDSTTDEAKLILENLNKHPQAKYIQVSNFQVVRAFYDNEKYTLMDLSNLLSELSKKIPVFALIGDEDGLFRKQDIDKISEIIGYDHVAVIGGASHNLFVDQQTEFLNKLVGFLGAGK